MRLGNDEVCRYEAAMVADQGPQGRPESAVIRVLGDDERIPGTRVDEELSGHAVSLPL